jgi:tetratricopeptide (TPR) repeat protein
VAVGPFIRKNPSQNRLGEGDSPRFAPPTIAAMVPAQKGDSPRRFCEGFKLQEPNKEHAMCRRAFWISIGVLIAAVAVGNGTLAWGASPSETLEKAIYTEETVGNVDEAIKLYEQVITEGKTARNAAAQAEYRLAQCLFKKNKPAEANAALEKLIADFPEEKELVAKARKQLPSELKLLPAPWQDHEAQLIDIKLGGGMDVGAYVYMIDSAMHDGKEAWRCTTRAGIFINNVESYSTVLADKESFAPISSRWMHTLLGDVEAVYKPQVVELTDLLKKTHREIALDGPIFDNEEAAELFRRLPLAVGYKTTFPIMATLVGNKIPLGLEVTGKETLEVPAGRFECFKVVLSIGQTFYISTDEHRYIVKFEAGGAIGELEHIYQLEPGKPLTFDGHGFTLTLPDRWFAYTPKPVKKDEVEKALFLDRDGAATCWVSAKTPKAEEKRKTIKERIAADSEEMKSTLKDFKVRADGIKESTIAGRPAFGVVADYTDGEKKMVMYGANVLGDKLEINFAAMVAADEFDAFQKEFDKVIDSLQLK